jgi:hypothetical protein
MCAIPALGCWPPAMAAKETNAQNPSKERLSDEFTLYLTDSAIKTAYSGVKLRFGQKRDITLG